LRELLQRVPIKDRIVYGTVLAVVVAGLALQPLWWLVDPNYVKVVDRLGASQWADVVFTALDPWERAFVVGAEPARAYSVGPNGVDEHMLGDDVPVTRGRWLAFSRLPEALFGIAALLAIFWEGGRAVRSTLAKPRGSLPVELRRAVALGSVPAVLLFGISWWVVDLIEQSAPGVVESAREALLVPLPVALAGSAFGVSTLSFLYLRTRESSPGST
jgi:hypothetical protein